MKKALLILFFPVLYPFAKLYELVGIVRNHAYDKGIFESKEFAVPIISVGNITVGGTGKTPHSEFILKLLNRSYKTALLSRGYKRKTKTYVEAKPDSTVYDIGDEPKQISLKFENTIVAVDANRCEGVANLMKNYPDLDVVVLDDAYQHRKIKPGFNIVLIDYNRLPHRDFLMPLGRLRENISGIKRADVVIFTKVPDALSLKEQDYVRSKYLLMPNQQIYFTSIKYIGLKTVFNETENMLNTENLVQFNVLLLTGIAETTSIQNFLKHRNINYKHLAYADHYDYSISDLSRIEKEFELMKGKKMVLTTEKDSYKFKEIVKKHNFAGSFVKSFYSLHIEVQFLNNNSISFENQIINYVENNKRNR